MTTTTLMPETPDYDMTTVVHNDTYPAIDSTKAAFGQKAVFISGASRGLGRAMSVSFAKAGASHIAIGARGDLAETIKAMREAVAKLGKPEPRILPIAFDLADNSSVTEAAQKVRDEFGRIDIVIGNAAIFTAGNIADSASDPNEWIRVLNVNVAGAYLLYRAFIPLMLEGGDKTFITTSSVGSTLRSPGLSAYQTSKLAVLRLAEFVCAEYGDQGVLAYCIHPGNIPTDMAASASPEGIPEILKPVFVETPELSADSLVYLTSEKRDWLAGRYINVTWDLPELMAKKDEIVSGDKLKVRMVV